MTVYAVYEPPTQAPDIAERAERLAFVKEGFSWVAFWVPILWLLYYRMWVEFILLALIYVALQLAFGSGDQGQAVVGWARRLDYAPQFQILEACRDSQHGHP